MPFATYRRDGAGVSRASICAASSSPALTNPTAPSQLEPPGEALVEWLRGTTLTDYERRLPDGLWDPFLARYRERLAEQLPDERPLPFPFLRTLLVARRPS